MSLRGVSSRVSGKGPRETLATSMEIKNMTGTKMRLEKFTLEQGQNFMCFFFCHSGIYRCGMPSYLIFFFKIT